MAEELEPSTLEKDQLWYYFYVTKDNWDRLLEFSKNDEKLKSECINNVRKICFQTQIAPAIKTKSTNHRSTLKEYYDNNKPVNWVATAGDISLPKGRQAGNLLLYHLAVEKVNSTPNLITGIYDIQRSDIQPIDHHAWLRISDIKYFGDQDHWDISFGDVIFGTSLVKKYTDRNGEDAYTLGTTIIRKSGFIEGNDIHLDCDYDSPLFLSLDDAHVMDYNHAGKEMLRLEYTKKATQKIKKMKSKSLENFKKAKYYLTTTYKKYHTYNYHDLIKEQQVAGVREELKKAKAENRPFEMQKKGSPIKVETYIY